jgi:hypothetical protein
VFFGGKMGKNKLQITYDFNFTLIALTVNLKPYRLAWFLNEKLDFSLAKQENIVLEFAANKKLAIVNYEHKTEYRTFKLLKNRAEEGTELFNAYLLPELKNFDYFLLLENESSTFDENVFLNKIKEIPFVQFAMKVDLDSLKSRDNLIF